jgi:hypothetical protein
MLITCKECNTYFSRKRKENIFCSRQCANDNLRMIKDPLEWFLREKFTRLRSNAKKRNKPLKIDWKYVLRIYKKQKGKCYYTGIPMTLHFDSKSYRICPPYTLSVDRKNNNKGYIKGNIVLCCYAINNLKGEYNLETLDIFFKAIKDNYGNFKSKL